MISTRQEKPRNPTEKPAISRNEEIAKICFTKGFVILIFSDRTIVKNPRRTPTATAKSETQKFTKNMTKPARTDHKIIRIKIFLK